MPKQVRLRRGKTAQHATFTGADGEVTFDTTKKALVLHDGVTAGGNWPHRTDGQRGGGIGVSEPAMPLQAARPVLD